MSYSLPLAAYFVASTALLLGDPVTLTLNPTSEAVMAGQMISVDVNINGLGTPPSAGAFDLTLAYDASLLSFQSVNFGPALGDPTLLEALTSFQPMAAAIEFAEVSLLAPAELDALQSSSFTLAAVSFLATETGTADFILTTGVVDDAFGNKLVSVPEPGGFGAIGLLLLTAFSKSARRKIIALIVTTGALFAATTTQKTKPSQIAATGRTSAPPRPAAPNVCVQHTVTVDSDTGTAKLKARFTNKDGNPKSFIFCQMIGVNDTEMVVDAECDIFLDGTTIKCKRANRQFSSAKDTFHFGCKLISLKGNEKQDVDYGSGQSDKFKGKKASDFKVTYADYVQVNAGVTFDADSCSANMCFGKDANTGLIRTAPVQIMGAWYLPKLPFDDPYISWQPVCKAPLPPEYSSFEQPLSTPSNFPVNVPQLPHNVPSAVPNSYPVDLNLFDIYTMSADSPSTSAALTPVVVPSMFSLDFVTSPPPEPATFVIPGGAESFGNLTILRPSGAHEGDSAEVDVVVHQPDTATGLGLALFNEEGKFIQDTVPPSVSRHSLLFDASNLLHVDVTAFDATTTPLGADFWYSKDGGVTWTESPLVSSSDLFDDTVHTRVFSSDIGVIPPGTNLQYFVTVQDEVFNMNFLGVGQAKPALSCDINGDGKVDITDINLIFAARGTTVSPGDARDVDRDCVITVNDARQCTLRCKNPNCAP